MVFVYSIINLMFSILWIKFSLYFSFLFRISFSFITTSFAIGFIPFIKQITNNNKKIGFYLSLIIIGYIGFTTSILQSSTIGFTNILPNKYTKYNISGQAISGILTCFIRIITKLFISNTIKISIYYFIIGSIGDILCFISFIFIINTLFVQYHLNKVTNTNTNTNIINCNKTKNNNFTIQTDLRESILNSNNENNIFRESILEISYIKNSISNTINSKPHQIHENINEMKNIQNDNHNQNKQNISLYGTVWNKIKLANLALTC